MKVVKPFIKDNFEFIYDNGNLAIINTDSHFANAKIGVFLDSQCLFIATLRNGIAEIPLTLGKYFHLYENKNKIEILRR